MGEILFESCREGETRRQVDNKLLMGLGLTVLMVGIAIVVSGSENLSAGMALLIRVLAIASAVIIGGMSLLYFLLKGSADNLDRVIIGTEGVKIRVGGTWYDTPAEQCAAMRIISSGRTELRLTDGAAIRTGPTGMSKRDAAAAEEAFQLMKAPVPAEPEVDLSGLAGGGN